MKNKRREFELAAVIDIGSRAVRMDILELAPRERPVLLECLEREVDLGREVFRTGEVSPGGIAMLCGIMADCRRKLDEYPRLEVRASADGALREAANARLVADRMFQAGGIMPELPGAAEVCRRFASAVRKALPTAFRRAVAVHVGAWSVHVLGFADGAMCFCEELPIGGDRLPEDMAHAEFDRVFADLLAASGVARRLEAALGGGGPDAVIAAGNGARRIAGIDDAADAVREFSGAEFKAAAGAVGSARSAAEAAGVVNYLFDVGGADRVLVPGFTSRNLILERSGEHDDVIFAADLAATATALSRRFGCDAGFAERMARAAAALWKKLRPRHAMPERSLPLLDAAARLYAVGNCFDGYDSGDRSAFIIGNLLLPGVSDAERRLVAATVRFARSGGVAFPAEVSGVLPEQQPTLFRLAALLRLAAALSIDPGDKFSGMHLNISGGELAISSAAAANGAERAALARGAELFMRVFGLEPRFGEVSL